MKREHKTWVMLALLVAVALGMAAWVLRPAARPNAINDPELACNPAACHDAPARELAHNKPGWTLESTPPPGNGAQPAPVEPFSDDDPLVAERPLHEPEYGPTLQLGGAKLVVHLRDAQGRALDSQPVNATLVRRLGRYGQAHGFIINGESDLIADGVDGFGLEPGDYDLRVGAGGYGSAETRLSIGRGETRETTLQMPTYMRIIHLRIEDQSGAAVKKLLSPPTYESGIQAKPAAEITVPAGVLRSVVLPKSVQPYEEDRAKDDIVGPVEGEDERVARRRREDRSPIFLTDEGSYYVRVFAGVMGKLSLKLDEKLYGRKEFEVESDFTGAEWADYRITLSLPTDFDALVSEGFYLANDGDPGNMSLVRSPTGDPAIPVPLTNTDDLKPGIARVMAFVRTRAPLYAWLDQVDAEGKYVTRHRLHWSEPDKAWFTDLYQTVSYEAVLTDGMFFVARRRFTAGDQKLVRIEVDDGGPEVLIAPPSPTCAAMATRCGVNAPGIAANEGQWGVLKPGEPIRSWLSAEQINDLPAEVRIGLKFTHGPEGPCTEVVASQILTDAQRAEFARGGFTVKPGAEGLILRATDGVSGLPFVEGVLLPAELDVASKRARKSLIKAGAKPPDAADPAAEFLKTSGTWYLSESDTRGARLRFDDFGYGRIASPLKAGKRYVLYLWSNSRDELVPDRRIDFIAKEGITDLGAIALPGYSG